MKFQKETRETKKYEGRHNGRRQVCPCCGGRVIAEHSQAQVYCSSCREYIRKLRDKYLTRINRLHTKVRSYNSLGTPGRIKQKLKNAERIKKRNNKLRQRVYYLEKKYGTDKN